MNKPVDDFMQRMKKLYPENFTGETIVLPDPNPEERAADKARMEELKRLVAPLIEWLRENYGPYTTVHISWDRVDVEQLIMGLPFPYPSESVTTTHEWRRFEPVPGSRITEEQVLEVLRRTKLSRTDLAIILVGLRVRPGIDLQALGVGPRNTPEHP